MIKLILIFLNLHKVLFTHTNQPTTDHAEQLSSFHFALPLDHVEQLSSFHFALPLDHVEQVISFHFALPLDHVEQVISFHFALPLGLVAISCPFIVDQRPRCRDAAVLQEVVRIVGTAVRALGQQYQLDRPIHDVRQHRFQRAVVYIRN
jgi:hypothetical protein